MTVIRIGAEQVEFHQPARFADGQTALLRVVDLSLDRDRLVIKGHGTHERWRLEDIRELPGPRGKTAVLACPDRPLARLYVDNRILTRRLPNLHRPLPTRRRWIWAWGLAAVASVVLLLAVLVPMMAERLAPFVPPSGEARLGEAVLSQLRNADGRVLALCEAPEGRAALNVMTERLVAASDPPVAATVLVLDHPVINAFALPGNQIVLFRGFVQAASGPEEIAAVLAHELAHVHRRDPTRGALRWGGSLGVLGLLLGDFSGGAGTVAAFDLLISSRHSREAEAEADAYARALLARAQIPPASLADFFATVADGPDGGTPASGFLRHFASHPDDAERAAAAQAATPEGFEARPVLNETQWSALRQICD